VLPLGRSGGQLQAEGVLLADHALPHMPVAMTLPVRGPWPATSVVGLAPGRQAELLETGRLELRHARPHWDGTTLWIEFTVVNHAGQELVGGLQGQLEGEAWAAAGYRFPPGGWLARLAFTPRRPRLWQPGRPEVYVVRVELADGATLSDATSLAIGLKEVTCERGRWRLHDQTLELINAENAADVGRAADRTATAVAVSPRNAPELLAEAERRGVPVVIESTAPAELLAAELLYGGRAAVLGTRLR
ncbi:MAG: hypothetical protein HUU35_15295, partial [Armatimonadetes bacterium]|nr:hypothetical protein [Armatimonadota bacterium]